MANGIKGVKLVLLTDILVVKKYGFTSCNHLNKLMKLWYVAHINLFVFVNTLFF